MVIFLVYLNRHVFVMEKSRVDSENHVTSFEIAAETTNEDSFFEGESVTIVVNDHYHTFPVDFVDNSFSEKLLWVLDMPPIKGIRNMDKNAQFFIKTF